MLDFAAKYQDHGKHSQNGEAGIIKECIKRIKLQVKVAVEFGAADGFFCSNTADLPKTWGRHLYDMEASGPVERKEITPANVNELPECFVLSIDIDGNDFNVWKAYRGKPAIVIIEINSDFSPGVRVYDKGTSYTPMVELGLSKGYFLLCHVGNLIFISDEYKQLFPEITADPLKEANLFFNTSWIL